MSLTYLFVLIAFVGIAMLTMSNAMYSARTKDNQVWRKFWLGKDILTKNEYILNRVGFVITSIGIVLTYWSRFAWK